MKEIVVVSGKGGTGKTTLTASLAGILDNIVLADCDVDAPDLAILLDPVLVKKEDFQGGVKASIDPDICTSCGLCREHCRFDAITEDYVVQPFSCEGCGVCEHVCPSGAVSLRQVVVGQVYQSDTARGPFVHARLYPGEEMSGKLAARVRKLSASAGEEQKADLVLTDGSPGAGCQVVSSVTGADEIIIVTEASLSGLHDLKRVHELLQIFKLPSKAVINKWNLAKDMSALIEEYCNTISLPLVLKIPYDDAVLQAVKQKKIPSQVEGNFFSSEEFRQFASSLTD